MIAGRMCESAPWAVLEPISSWSKRAIKQIRWLSFRGEGEERDEMRLGGAVGHYEIVHAGRVYEFVIEITQACLLGVVEHDLEVLDVRWSTFGFGSEKLDDVRQSLNNQIIACINGDGCLMSVVNGSMDQCIVRGRLQSQFTLSSSTRRVHLRSCANALGRSSRQFPSALVELVPEAVVGAHTTANGWFAERVLRSKTTAQWASSTTTCRKINKSKTRKYPELLLPRPLHLNSIVPTGRLPLQRTTTPFRSNG
jgi:hypothetical protein